MKRATLITGTIILIAILALIIKAIQFYRTIYKPQNGQKQTVIKDAYNILLLGYGGGTHEGGRLTDSMILAHIDLKNKKALLVSLPRDLWVSIPTKSNQDYHVKINALYQMEYLYKNEPETYDMIYPEVNNNKLKDGNIGNLITTVVGEVTGLPVDNLIAVDFTGFKKAIDTLGGVDVNVEKTFDDYRYPIDGKEKELCGKDNEFNLIKDYLNPPYDNEARVRLLKEKPELDEFLKNATDEPQLVFPCRYEHLHFNKGITHMDGETALKYVRSRYGLQDGSDFGRAARQQQFIQAVKEKVLSIGFVPKIIPLLNDLKNHISIDISPEQMQHFFAEAGSAGKYSTDNLVITNTNYLDDDQSDDGQYILVPTLGIDNWSEIKSAINVMIMEITPTIFRLRKSP